MVKDEISILELLDKGSSNPDQAANIMGFLDQVNKAVTVLDSIMSKVNKIGLTPEVLEKIAIKFGGLDKVAELPKHEKPSGIQARTPLHAAIFEQFNNMDEKQLQDLIEKQKAVQKVD
jgi:hypothetical protein